MARGTKRVSAVLAKAKIKTITEQSFYIDSDTGRHDCRSNAKSRSSSVFDFDGIVAVDEPHRSKLRLKTKSNHSQNQQKRLLRNRGSDMNITEAKRSKEVPLKRFSATESSANDLSGHLSSSSSSPSTRSARQNEFMTAEKVDRQRRRSIRSLNSTGPMILSYRTSYRISMSRFSPECSPIVSTRLRFTPVAHIPTTPTHAA